MVMNNIKVHIGLSTTFGEPQAMKVAINPCIPNSRGLFEPIGSFLQFTHMGLIPMSHKAFWLFNVDFLIKFSIEKGCFYINVMKFPYKRNNKRDDGSDSGISDNKRKSLIIVYAFLLSAAMRYKYGLVVLNVSIRNMLDFLDPSRCHH